MQRKPAAKRHLAGPSSEASQPSPRRLAAVVATLIPVASAAAFSAGAAASAANVDAGLLALLDKLPAAQAQFDSTCDRTTEAERAIEYPLPAARIAGHRSRHALPRSVSYAERGKPYQPGDIAMIKALVDAIHGPAPNPVARAFI